jgi:hypothetical protein
MTDNLSPTSREIGATTFSTPSLHLRPMSEQQLIYTKPSPVLYLDGAITGGE